MLLAREVRTPFDLGKAPLVALAVAKLGPAKHVLMVVMHHTVMDGWSFGRLLPDILGLYYSLARSQPAGLPALPFQYSDYAVWEVSAGGKWAGVRMVQVRGNEEGSAAWQNPHPTAHTPI